MTFYDIMTLCFSHCIIFFLTFPNLIDWLRLPLVILRNKCVVIVFHPVYDIINFKIFVIKAFYFIVKKSGQKLKYLDSKMSFWYDIKNIFHRFLKWSLVTRNCRGPKKGSCIRQPSNIKKQYKNRNINIKKTCS